MAVGVYEAVWLFVAFDLPTLTKDDRRRASRFRNDLLDMGFSMFQLSFYAYYLKSKQQAETIAKAISRGKDVELRKSASGISVCEVSKKVVSR